MRSVRLAFALLAILLAVVVSTTAQMPVIQCPQHNIPSQFTGRIDSSSGARLCEYRHPGPDHIFWTACQ
jgi:hypothetical protein